MRLCSAMVPAILLVLSQVPARADIVSFNFTLLPSSPDDPVSFTLDTSQAPSTFGPVFDGITFYYTNVPVLSNGVTYTREVGFGDFVEDINGNYNALFYEFGVGQIVVINPGAITIGPTSPRAGFFNDTAFFSGTPGAPVFIPGVYTYPMDGILTIKDLTPATTVTPEPSSFALLGTGLLGLAALLRRRSLATASS